jgi:Tol biopolymer transport system component
MTHELDNPHGSGPSMPGSSSKVIIATALVAMIAVLFQASIEVHGQGTRGVRAWRLAQPVPGNVNTPALEGCPLESPDGHYLFMASNRSDNLDIWAAYRETEDDAWGVPSRLPEPVNSEFDDFCPTPLTGGRLMFVSTRPSLTCAPGAADIYETRLDPAFGWLPPEILPCAAVDDVNTFAAEFSPSLVEAEGRTILFFSSAREGVQKIYTSERQANGKWGPAVAVEELNSGFQDARPNVSHNGLEIVFDSTRDGGPPDIWTATRWQLSEPWSAPRKLGTNVNSDAAEARASLSRDGTRLYFGSTRQGGQFDIYVARRFNPPGPPR